MAQSRTYFGLRRGSTKTQTFSVLNGKQITKDRQEGGRNPQTPEQMQQRMVMATVSAAYAQMKRIVDHSFEGVTYGGQTMAEFIKVNAAALRQNLIDGGSDFGYNPYRDRELYPGMFVMSRGSAPSLNIVSDSSLPGIFPYVSATQFSGPGVVLKVAGAPESFTANDILSVMGCKAGDMATACFLASVRDISGYTFAFLRIKCLKAGDIALTSSNLGEFFSFESEYNVQSEVTANALIVNLDIPRFESDMPGATCVIHSLKTSTGWLRSNEIFALEQGIDVSPTAEDALASYPVGPSYVLNGGQV